MSLVVSDHLALFSLGSWDVCRNNLFLIIIDVGVIIICQQELVHRVVAKIVVLLQIIQKHLIYPVLILLNLFKYYPLRLSKCRKSIRISVKSIYLWSDQTKKLYLLLILSWTKKDSIAWEVVFAFLFNIVFTLTSQYC